MSDQEIGTTVAPHRGAPLEEAQRGGGEVTDLIKIAMDKGVDVAVLERLVALKERVTDRDARLAYMNALAAFQRECPVVIKTKPVGYETKAGGSVNYTYAPLPEICKQIGPTLEKYGLSYSWTTKEAAHPQVLLVVCRVRHVDGHEEISEFPVPTANDAKMSAAQRLGAALTYGRRQSLVSVLGIVTADEDDDALDRETGEVLTDDQVEALNNRIDQLWGRLPDAAHQKQYDRFLKFMGVEALGQIRRQDYQKAMAALNP